jgi:hypothetical protein
MLVRTEERFGNGDGTFTVAEQRAAFGSLYDLLYGSQWLQKSNRLLRIGVQVDF